MGTSNRGATTLAGVAGAAVPPPFALAVSADRPACHVRAAPIVT